ncbi:MAG: Helix-turn-helix domain [Chloroflexota bacterium]|jgi:excisionase family DNA binding protein|nr:Helix-turn-helix domain [Chloroflexota bacterium]
MVGSDLEIRPNAVYTLAEVCRILKISDATMRRWLKSGKIRGARVGRAYRVLGSQLLEALSADGETSQTAARAVRR